MPLDANEAELIRLREMLKWQTRLTGQLQQELRVERAIGDFWAAEAIRNRKEYYGDGLDDAWSGETSGIRAPLIVWWHAHRRQP